MRCSFWVTLLLNAVRLIYQHYSENIVKKILYWNLVVMCGSVEMELFNGSWLVVAAGI